MHIWLRENITEDSLYDFLDNIEKLSIDIGIDFLKDNQWSDVANRLVEGTYTGVGTPRLLTRMCLEYQAGSFDTLIDFYENTKRPSDEPHFEDLIGTLVLNIIGGLLANLIYNYAHKHIRNYCLHDDEINSIIQKNILEYGNSIDYVMKSYWVRKLHYQHKISKKEFEIFLTYSKKEWKNIKISKHDVHSSGEYKRYVEMVESIARSDGFDPNRVSDSFIRKIIITLCKKFKKHDLDELIEQNERYFV
jgi:hypothetical protein